MNKTPLKQIDEIEEVSVSESTPPECGEGFVYDEAEGKCVPIKKKEKRIEPVKIEVNPADAISPAATNAAKPNFVLLPIDPVQRAVNEHRRRLEPSRAEALVEVV